MFQRNSFKRPALILIGMAMLLTGTIQGQKSKKSHPKPIPNDAKPVLWHEPTDIASRDLFLGSGGEAMKPDLSKVTFVADETRSYSKKYRVWCRTLISKAKALSTMPDLKRVPKAKSVWANVGIGQRIRLSARMNFKG